MRWLVPDFETVSDEDLQKAGSRRYSRHWSTQVLCLSWEFDNGVRGSWTKADGPECPAPLLEALACGDVFVAHNAGFETAIWQNVMVATWGWPPIPDEQWADSMARCAELALPQKLDRVCVALDLPFQKDNAASKRTIALSKNDAVVTEADLEDTVAYNVSDVDAQKALHKRIGWLSPNERRVWDMSNRVNARGVGLDIPLIRQMKKVLAEAEAPLAEEFRQLTGFKPSQNKKVLAWVQDRGIGIDSLNKEIVTPLLDDQQWVDSNADEDENVPEPVPLPDDVFRALSIRALIGSASVKKLDAMEACVIDGRAYDLVSYHVAGTGRFGGRRLQPQNFPRGSNEVGTLSVEDKMRLIWGNEQDVMAALFGSAYELVIGSLRHCLIPAPGCMFDVADYAQIEARVLLALAGQRDKVDLLASGASPYIDMGQQIYGRVIDKKTEVTEYTISKNSVLGLGFQMAWATFQRRYAKGLDEMFLRGVVDTYRTKWAPKVPPLWYALAEAAERACIDGHAETHGVEYRREDIWLTARLPSGRKLWYPFPTRGRRAMPWGDIKWGWNYKATKVGQWRTVWAFGGLLAENVVQALARDLLVHSMARCEEEGIPVVLTVHDEIVAEVSAGQSNHKVLEQVMEDMPDWARELRIPVKAEGWSGERYRK